MEVSIASFTGPLRSVTGERLRNLVIEDVSHENLVAGHIYNCIVHFWIGRLRDCSIPPNPASFRPRPKPSQKNHEGIYFRAGTLEVFGETG